MVGTHSVSVIHPISYRLQVQNSANERCRVCIECVAGDLIAAELVRCNFTPPTFPTYRDRRQLEIRFGRATCETGQRGIFPRFYEILRELDVIHSPIRSAQASLAYQRILRWMWSRKMPRDAS